MRWAPLLLMAAGLVCGRQLPIRVYTTADGLAGGEIQRIVRDSRGYLWFCTSNGLSRFDGYRFVNYGMEDGLPNDAVFDILEQPGGALVGRHTPGPRRVPSRQQASLHAAPRGGQAEPVRAQADARSRRTALGGNLRRLFRAEGDTFARVPLGEPDEYAGTWVTSILEDRFGALWVGLRSGVYGRWPDGRVERYTPKNANPFWNVEALLEDRSGRLWVGMRGALCLLRNNPNARAVIQKVYTARDGLPPGNAVWALLEGSDGRLWAGGQDGFAQILAGPGGSRGQVCGLRSKKRIAEHRVRCAGRRPVGQPVDWHGSGAARVARSGFSTYTEADGLTTAGVASVFESRDGKLEVTSSQAGHPGVVLNQREGDRFRVVHAPLRGGTFTSGQIALQARSGEWWFATAKGCCAFRKPITPRNWSTSRRKPTIKRDTV
jgi:ligand-binding sensor domain-containing protein